MSDHVEKTIGMVQEQISDLERQVSEKKKIVNSLCVLINEPALYHDVEPQGALARTVRPDQFYGRPLATVAREVLEMKKQAAMVAEIYATMVQGGFEFEAKTEENAKRSLRISLSKNTAVFHKLPNGTYGLLEWYPNVRNGRGDEASASRKAASIDSPSDIDPELAEKPKEFTDRESSEEEERLHDLKARKG